MEATDGSGAVIGADARGGSGVKPWLFPLLVVVAVLITYGSVVGHEFLVWDDNQHVTDNPAFHPPTWASLARFWAAPVVGMYVPASYTLFWLETVFTGTPDPCVFHATNLLLFTLCAVLVWRVLSRLVRSDRAALVGALVFALHPLQVESVAWISETRGTLAAALGLLALDRWLAIVREAGPPRARDVALVSVAFALSLLSKPSTVVLPVVALVIARVVLDVPARRLVPWVAGGLALALVPIWITKSRQADEAIRFVTPLVDRPRVALDALGFYITKLVAPFDLVPDYGRRPAVLLAEPADWQKLLLPIVLAAASLATRTLRAVLLPGALVFVVALAPVLGLVPFAYQDLSTVADRYALLALLGVGLTVALALDRARRPWAVGGASVALVGCGILSARQCAPWHDTERLFARTSEVNPRSWIARTNTGMAKLARGDRAGALAEYQRALALRPEHPKAFNNIGLMLVQDGKFSEAIPYLTRALELFPAYGHAHANLAVALFHLGRLEESESHARSAVEHEPDEADVHNTLANVLVARGSLDEAAREYEVAIELAPAHADAHRNYALLLVRQGRIPRAIAHYETALAARPGWREVAAELERLRAATRRVTPPTER